MVVPSPSPAPDKSAIRAAARRARRALGEPRPAIMPVAQFLALLSPGTVVASYAPVGGEADPAPLAAAALAAGCALALPHVVDRATPLRFLAWHPGEALLRGPFGLHQPADHPAEVAPDVVLTPLVAFDRTLARLGQGAGHYDRAFARFPRAQRIGVAFSVQQVDSLPADPWDMPLHAVITEREWITR